LSLSNIYSKYKPDSEPPAELGHSRDWNVDLIPKFIMACGDMVKILLHAKVTRYLEFKSIAGSYVYKDSKVQKVPSTGPEALNSSLMGFFEKRKFRNFLLFLQAYDVKDPKTWRLGKPNDKLTMKQLFDDFGLDANTCSFTGHAMALMTSDDYLAQRASDTCEAIQLYAYSVERYGQSPYIYPMYGLGGLPEGFSRLCAIHGGTFMLNKGVDEVLLNEQGKAWAIKTGNEVAKAPLVIGEPSYFPPEKSRVIGQTVRSICFLNHPIQGTDNADSAQIIIPAAQIPGRKNDIYVAMVSSAHRVCSNNMYIAIVSTTVETSNPIAELNPGIALLKDIVERFDSVNDIFAPVADGTGDKCYISKSYDASSHFESTAADVLSLYERITGEQLDMTVSPDLNEDDY
jgi:Rab GDP dissociation inhibitor